MKFKQTAINGLLEGVLSVSEDARGKSILFRLCENSKTLKKPFVDLFTSTSRQNVIRGLHAESVDKLIYVSRGRILTAIADVRPTSPTFGKVVTFTWGDQNPRAIYVPEGCAHGYYVLSASMDCVYLFTGCLTKDMPKRAIAWNDPDLAIQWPTRDPILSDADKHNPTLRQSFPEKFQ